MSSPDSPLPAEDIRSTQTGTSSNVLDEALARVRALDPALAGTLSREVAALRDGRSFGLVFERHLPEAIRLPDHPVKRGVQVAPRTPISGPDRYGTRRVVKVSGRGDAREALLDDDTTRPVSDLVVVRDFGDPVYPGLRSLERIERGSPADPTHVVINGENQHVLQTLLYTHRKSVDLIYIDPPYNTGNNGWIYNDRYVAEQDAFKHSKWLSFMERRLVLARNLLKDTGVIIVAIDDTEQGRLKVLLDQVMGEQNFIANVVWQGGQRNDAKYVATGHDYMLIYARSESSLSQSGVRWREGKVGLAEASAAAIKIWEEADGNHPQATSQWRAWMTNFKKQSGVTDGVARYTTLDELTGEPIYTGQNLSSPNPRPNLQYDLLHPVTGKPVRRHPNGWRYSETKMAALVEQGRVRFGKDETSGAQGISFLSEFDTQIAKSIFEVDRRRSAKRLVDILSEKRFPHPKDHEVLARWIRLTAPSNAVVLDFFGGSGSTAEAVMQLNAEDGGSRQCLLVTNNEVADQDAKALTKAGHVPGDAEWEAAGVFEYVTRPRLSTVVTGVRPDGSTYDEGVLANVEFLEATYLDEARVQRAKEFEAIAPLLWLRAGATGPRIDQEPEAGWAVAGSYGVLTDVDAAEGFLHALMQAIRTNAALEVVFVVTDSASDFAAVTARLPKGLKANQLYASYLRNFEINNGAAL